MRDYQKIYPCGKLHFNGAEFYLIDNMPQKPSSELWIPINGYAWNVVPIIINPIFYKDMPWNTGIKEETFSLPILSSPRTITITGSFYIEWGTPSELEGVVPDFIICRPTGPQVPSGEE